MLLVYPPDRHFARLLFCFQRDFQKFGIIPEVLRPHEVDAVFGLVGLAFLLVELKLHGYIISIPFLSSQSRPQAGRTLFPRAAFEATGSDLLKLAGAQGESVDRQLTPFEGELQENLLAILYIHMPQFPSSRAFGSYPIEDTVDYFQRVPLQKSKWKVGGPTSPRPFPPPH